MTITKSFPTIKKAEHYQMSLYNKYNSVQLISFPMFSEAGNYVWKVM